MVLFDKDLSAEKCIIDYSTPNLSFIKMSYLLKQMGIKNNKFMLVLVQPELQGVDPHDQTLSEIMKMRIGMECKINPWYFFREVIRINVGGGDPIRYILNRANLALIWLHLNSIDLFLTMPRQVGKTIGVQGLMAFKMFLQGKNINVGLFAKDNDLRMENVSRLKEIRNALPKYLYKVGPKYNTDNQEGLVYKPFKTKYITFVAQKDKRSASGQGRGQTFTDEHWDEFGYYTNNHLSYPSAKAATDTAQPQARANGIPCANILTTTAAMLEDPAGMYAHGIKCDALRFTELLYDCADQEELRRLVESGSDGGMVYVEYSYKQLGKDDDWLKRVSRGKTQDEIDRDYLNIWTHGSMGALINASVLKKLKLNTIESLHTEIREDLILRWYVDNAKRNSPEFKNRPFIISSDNADNVGKDATSIVIIDPSNMEVIMVCKSNQSNFAHIVMVILYLMREFPRSILIPERNKNGAVMIDMILHATKSDRNFDPWARIYNEHHQDYNSKSPDHRRLDLNSGSVRKLFGFTTTGAANSRKLLYQTIFITAVNRNVERIHDSTLIDEISGITVDPKGRIDHTSDSHDDVLIAYLIACWFIMYGRNHHMYGIRDNEILQDFSVDSEAIDPITKDRNKKARERMKYLEEMLSGNSISRLIRDAFSKEFDYLKRVVPDKTTSEDIISLKQLGEETEKTYVVPVQRDEFTNSLQHIGF